MKKVLIVTSDEGHVSIAHAISQKLSGHFEVSVLEYQIKEFDLYLPIYQLFPSLFKYPYKLAEYKTAQEFARRLISKRYEKKIIAAMAAYSPDIVISTYFMYDHICVAYGKQHDVPVWNVLANPHSVHPLELCEGTVHNLFFDQIARDKAISYEMPADKLEITGWFVREEFQPVRDKQESRKKLHLHPTIPTFLISAGSDGTGMILKILPLVFQVSTPLQIICICGNNRSLYKAVQIFEKTFRYTQKQTPITIQAHGFVKNMHEYMAASDLVVGKAGPNSLFESVAVHTPFFATTHITGQEDGNLEIIEEKRLGFVEESPLRAIKMLKEIAENPSVLDQFVEPIKQMADYNAQSGKKLLQLLNAV